MNTDYDFKTFQFGSGAHDSREDGLCVMEAVAYVAGEPHSDRPKCASPVLSAFCRSWNDGLPSDAERNKWLAEFVWRLPGTVASAEIELRRSEMCIDWLVREYLPAFLDLTECLQSHAEDLRGLPELRCDNFDLAVPVVVAAGDAAGTAAGTAAWDAARAAAWDADRAAAWTAAWDADRAAAWDAAWDALSPTVETLKQSARDLLDRMVRLTEPQEAVTDKTELANSL